MGSYAGHALPGSIFIVIGLWWLFHVVLDYAAGFKEKRKNRMDDSDIVIGSWRRLPWKRFRSIPFEPGFKLLGCLAGIIAEVGTLRFQLVNAKDEFTRPNRFSHATMYAFFAFSGLVEIFNVYKVVKFSKEAEYTLLALAFAVEGTLFAFHLHGRDIFDVRIHTLLYIIIYLAALVVLLEACLPRFRRELFVARTVLVLTQGTWFWEIAYTKFGANKWFGNATRDLTEKQLASDTEVVTTAVMWHLFGWLSIVMFFCSIANCLYKYDRLPQCCFVNGDDGESLGSLREDLFDENEQSRFDEEEILLTQDS
ncbi:transmembrane protein 45B-like [Dendronephthya gigantea]|uniref:transmembrane protein 45B-like n=1 Tax=Dendronephthya gigantea TaxID=151771 RepID=UPI00106B4919|nr:transmembrane protein 45B-like [Dendronephthya gigantea]